MAYFLDLFSPETYEAFGKSKRDVSGFRPRQESAARRIKPGDKLICYMTKLSRWFGILEVTSSYFIDPTPIFYPEDDPFIIRFQVKPLAWLDVKHALPIKEPDIWSQLSFTRSSDGSAGWTGKLRSSLTQLSDADGKFLEARILEQLHRQTVYDYDDHDYQKLTTHRVRRADGVVSVSVPQEPDRTADDTTPEVRESIKIQALLAQIGAQMGHKIWLPRNDRNAVLHEWQQGPQPLLEALPLNYDETTIKTIEQIDVIWLRGRSIVRAFEVEHTTSIYSGILRMADLLALQPNMDIKLHIVAPEARRDKVFQEIQRPVFSLLERGPLASACTYLSYDSVRQLAKERHLAHLSDGVLEEYTEEAD